MRWLALSDRKSQTVYFISVEADPNDVSMARNPGNRKNWDCQGNIERTTSSTTWRATHFERGSQAQGLISGRSWNVEGNAVFVFEGEVNGMTRIGFIPVNF